MSEDKSEFLYQFLFFMCGVEDTGRITDVFMAETTTFRSLELKGENVRRSLEKLDAAEILVKEEHVLEEALLHALKINSVLALDYVVQKSRLNLLPLHIEEEFLAQVVVDACSSELGKRIL